MIHFNANWQPHMLVVLLLSWNHSAWKTRCHIQFEVKNVYASIDCWKRNRHLMLNCTTAINRFNNNSGKKTIHIRSKNFNHYLSILYWTNIFNAFMCNSYKQTKMWKNTFLNSFLIESHGIMEYFFSLPIGEIQRYCQKIWNTPLRVENTVCHHFNETKCLNDDEKWHCFILYFLSFSCIFYVNISFSRTIFHDDSEKLTCELRKCAV